MKLARIGAVGAERPAVQDDAGRWRDLSGVVPDVAGALLDETIPAVREALERGDLPVIDEPGRFGAPVGRIGKVVCVGLNYRDHAEETNAAIPAEPILFFKAADTVVGPDDEVLVPRGSTKTDYEVELAVVIGRKARYVGDDEDPLSYVAGYATSHDVSEREFQLERGGQWDKGKNCETFNPLGPWLVTADEVGDPQALGLTLSVNGEVRQDGTSAQMIFPVAELVRYISRFMVLYPGDVINTGTPAGVALGRPEAPYLRAGDVVTLEVAGLGTQTQTLGAA
ncbi:MAG: fumarylacetoacetate hydrolase family protein [Promicromonosporaceae bacterium]|nr:fumarylacetoacetate hydrolase family protein [Promicromonosporaceae bacterium]